MDESLQKNILHELRMIKRLLAHNMMTGDKQTAQISKLNSIGFTFFTFCDIISLSKFCLIASMLLSSLSVILSTRILPYVITF